MKKKPKINSDNQLRELIDEITSTSTQEALQENAAEELLKRIWKVIPFDAATLYWKNSAGEYHATCIIGDTVELVDNISIGGGAGLTGWAAESGEPLLLSDRSKRRSFNPGEDFGSFLSLPLVIGGETVGVINFGATEVGSFNERTLESVKPVVKVLALSLLRIFYLNQLQNAKSEAVRKQKVASELKTQMMTPESALLIVQDTSSYLHEINNSLSIVIGNIQCLLVEDVASNQKVLSRLRRIEAAALKIAEANQKILQINGLVNNYIQKKTVTSNA